MPHPPHPAIVRRLKRADGHLQSIIAMIEEGRPCMQIAQQLQAVENAIDNAKKALIHDHIDHCLREAPGGARTSSRKLVDEFREVAKYL